MSLYNTIQLNDEYIIEENQYNELLKTIKRMIKHESGEGFILPIGIVTRDHMIYIREQNPEEYKFFTWLKDFGNKKECLKGLETRLKGLLTYSSKENDEHSNLYKNYREASESYKTKSLRGFEGEEEKAEYIKRFNETRDLYNNYNLTHFNIG